MSLEILQIPALSDNYNYLIHAPESNETVVVDPSEAAPVLEILRDRDWNLQTIWNTHHHPDHTGGNLELQAATGCEIWTSEYDRKRIPGCTRTLGDGDSFRLGNHRVEVLFVPGHTLGHIAYFLPEEPALFCGDTVFGMGCGRLFEGTPTQMFDSFRKIQKLSDTTRIYCAHEYTQTNGEFALKVNPNNPDLRKRYEGVLEARAQNHPTVPFTLADEKKTNPFMRPFDSDIRTQLGMETATDLEVFTELRKLRNQF